MLGLQKTIQIRYKFYRQNLNLIGSFLLQPTNGDDVCFQLKVLFSHLQVEFLPMRNQLDC